jgi:hypothetical protein
MIQVTVIKSRIHHSLAWFVAACFVSNSHEVWRDEARALSIAIESISLAELVRTLETEGHPILWYLLDRDVRALGLDEFLGTDRSEDGPGTVATIACSMECGHRII